MPGLAPTGKTTCTTYAWCLARPLCIRVPTSAVGVLPALLLTPCLSSVAVPPQLFHPQPLAPCSYVMLCAPQSVVQQCKAQPALDSLRPAMQLFTAARKLCGGSSAGAQAPTAAPARDRVGVAAQDLPPAPAAADAAGACSRCSSQSFDPNKVTVQAVQSNCPDPLGESHQPSWLLVHAFLQCKTRAAWLYKPPARFALAVGSLGGSQLLLLLVRLAALRCFPWCSAACAFSELRVSAIAAQWCMQQQHGAACCQLYGPYKSGWRSCLLPAHPPAGTLSALCLESSENAHGEACAAWREICESGDGSSFPGLCGGAAAPTPATAGKLAAPSPGPGEAGTQLTC